jgi:hypothetical protein
MQWFETVPGPVRATVDAYLAAAAAHERAAEAARRAAVAAQALTAQVPGAGDPPGTIPTTGGAAREDAAGAGPADTGPIGVTTADPGGFDTGEDGAGGSAAGSAPATTGIAASGMAASGLPWAGAGLGVAGGGPWPGELLAILARRLPTGDLVLASLSEAELAAATGEQPSERRLVPLPHLDVLPPWTRGAAVAAGWESLARRGLLAADGQPAWALAALLAVRTLPRAVTVAGPERQLPAPCHYVYGAGGDAVLEEVVDPAGTHHFTLRSRASACARLARLADPYGRARASSPPLVADDPAGMAEWAAVHTAIARAEHITQVSTTRPGTAAAGWLLLRLIAGPDGLLALACRQATGASQATNIRWLSGWALQRLLLACLDVAPVVAAR